MDNTTFFKAVEENIKTHGWHLTQVFPVEEGDGEWFTYTTGLATKGLPELMIFGQGEKFAGLLNHIGERSLAIPLVLGADNPGLFKPPYTPFVIKVDKSHYEDYFGVSRGYYKGNGFDVLQLVIPDTEGKYPWDGGTLNQPILGPVITPQ